VWWDARCRSATRLIINLGKTVYSSDECGCHGPSLLLATCGCGRQVCMNLSRTLGCGRRGQQTSCMAARTVDGEGRGYIDSKQASRQRLRGAATWLLVPMSERTAFINEQPFSPLLSGPAAGVQQVGSSTSALRGLRGRYAGTRGTEVRRRGGEASDMLRVGVRITKRGNRNPGLGARQG
jgi:hypothetical protein